MIMIFRKRADLAMQYDAWLEEKNKELKEEGMDIQIKGCALSVISFLDIKGLLKEGEDSEIL